MFRKTYSTQNRLIVCLNLNIFKSHIFYNLKNNINLNSYWNITDLSKF
jgi:hypothetical protein